MTQNTSGPNKCKMCHLPAILRRSHIIPEFIYKPLYDQKHKFHVLSRSSTDRKYEQKGLRERLLCSDCEEILSLNEDYACRVLTGKIPLNFEKSRSSVLVSGIDYKKFRLFALSILWRAGVSQDRFFSNVNLGPHEELIRNKLIKNDPGPPFAYPFVLASIHDKKRHVVDLIVKPTATRLKSHRCYSFIFGGFLWSFIVSAHAPPIEIRRAILTKQGHMTLLNTDIAELKSIFYRFLI